MEKELKSVVFILANGLNRIDVVFLDGQFFL